MDRMDKAPTIRKVKTSEQGTDFAYLPAVRAPPQEQLRALEVNPEGVPPWAIWN